MLATSALLPTPARADTVGDRFPAPAGQIRIDAPAGSFGAHLRTLPLLPPGTPVKAFDGRVLAAPWAKAVVDLDVGPRDLQQCADSAIRVFADWYVTRRAAKDLHFHATSGDDIPLARYLAGDRAFAKGNRLAWRTGGEASKATTTTTTTTPAYRAFLQTVFMYAGSASLAKDTTRLTSPRAGGILVRPGSPGHVLVILDVARDAACATKTTCPTSLLLAQGFMPAQSFHVLGWYPWSDVDGVTVPSWPEAFAPTTLRRFALDDGPT